jgi:hypothetical protein
VAQRAAESSNSRSFPQKSAFAEATACVDLRGESKPGKRPAPTEDHAAGSMQEHPLDEKDDDGSDGELKRRSAPLPEITDAKHEINDVIRPVGQLRACRDDVPAQRISRPSSSPNPTQTVTSVQTVTHDLQERARALLAKRDDDASEVANTTDSEHGDDPSLGGDIDAEVAHGRGAASRRTRRKWNPVDKERLRAYLLEDQDWGWIERQFPDRTEAALRNQKHLLQQHVVTFGHNETTSVVAIEPHDVQDPSLEAFQTLVELYRGDTEPATPETASRASTESPCESVEDGPEGKDHSA